MRLSNVIWHGDGVSVFWSRHARTSHAVAENLMHNRRWHFGVPNIYIVEATDWTKPISEENSQNKIRLIKHSFSSVCSSLTNSFSLVHSLDVSRVALSDTIIHHSQKFRKNKIKMSRSSQRANTHRAHRAVEWRQKKSTHKHTHTGRCNLKYRFRLLRCAITTVLHTEHTHTHTHIHTRNLDRKFSNQTFICGHCPLKGPGQKDCVYYVYMPSTCSSRALVRIPHRSPIYSILILFYFFRV